jgi:hypothetical protein
MRVGIFVLCAEDAVDIITQVYMGGTQRMWEGDMAKQYNFKKEWGKTRAQLAKFSKEAVEVAQKGEKELVQFSRRSKIRMDATAIGLRKEHLYYLIGKEYGSLKNPLEPSVKLNKLVAELKNADKQQRVLRRALKVVTK